MSPASPPPTPTTAARDELRGRVERVLTLIRPAIQADGGDIEFVGMTDAGTVQIRLHGACVGCPSSAMTLKFGIERNLRAYVPEVKAVEAIA